MELNLIYAISEQNIFSSNESIPWKCSDDMQHFKNTTLNSIIIMGRKTYESLPSSLSNGFINRFNIVISSNIFQLNNENLLFLNSINDALKYIEINLKDKYKKIFIIGGINLFKSIFNNKKLFNKIDNVYESVIKNFKVDLDSLNNYLLFPNDFKKKLDYNFYNLEYDYGTFILKKYFKP